MSKKQQRTGRKRAVKAAMPGYAVSVKELAAEMGVSEVHVGRFVKEGMPKVARGRYPLVECLKWDNRRLRGLVKRKETENQDGSSTNITAEKKGLLRAQRERAEFELQKARAEWVPTSVYETYLRGRILTTRQRLLIFPARVVMRLDGDPRINKPILVQAIHDALTAMAVEGENGNRSDTGTVPATDGGRHAAEQPLAATTKPENK
jgi:phage terminase Nu1 subunit (DNA packaging protein)